SLFEPSFQLSFAAMSAIIFYSRYLMLRRKRVKMGLIPGFAYKLRAAGRRFAGILSEYFKLSFVIWLFTSPVVLFRFDTFNLLTPLVNIPVVFLSTLIINTSFISLLAAVCSSLGVKMLGICGILVRPLVSVAGLFSGSAFDIENIYLKMVLLGFILVCVSIIFLYAENATE
ncbi:MAG: ComEC/Rec2 family competence protein, partial [Candidatus Aureabacteria bacterium]|nr:ComEC/Rec2 family competence protein [Candidatus Auribacterota bacterium]